MVLVLVGFFVFAGGVEAIESEGLDRALGISMDGESLILVDGGGSDWSNNGSEVLGFGEDGVLEWRYKGRLVFAHSANKMANGNWLVTNTGLDEILEISEEGELLWSSRQWQEGGSSVDSKLDYPNDAEEIRAGVYLVVDRNNDRVIKITREGEVLWEYDDLYRPHNADLLENGNVLVSDSERNRVLEVNEDKEIVWQFERDLNWPRDVDLMENGNYLIADSRNHRVLEVSKQGEVVWEFSEGLYWPYEADELVNGDIIIADSQNRRVVQVNKEGEMVKSWGYDLNRDLRDSFINGGFEREGVFEADVEREIEYKEVILDVNRLVDGRVAEGWRPGVIIGEDEGMLSLDDQEFKKGEKSGRIDYRGDGHVFWLEQFEAVEQGRWRLTGFIKTDSQERPGRGARFEVWIEGKRGGFIGEPVVSGWVKGDEKWQKVSLEIELPEEGEVIQIRALFNDTGRAWFDEVSWKKIGWWQSWGKWFVLGLGVVVVARLILSLKKNEE